MQKLGQICLAIPVEEGPQSWLHFPDREWSSMAQTPRFSNRTGFPPDVQRRRFAELRWPHIVAINKQSPHNSVVDLKVTFDRKLPCVKDSSRTIRPHNALAAQSLTISPVIDRSIRGSTSYLLEKFQFGLCRCLAAKKARESRARHVYPCREPPSHPSDRV